MRAMRNILIFVSFALPLFLAPVLLGGAYSHVDMNRILIFAVSVIYIFYASYLLASEKRIFIPSVFYPLALLALWAFIMLIPLPQGMIKILSGRAYSFISSGQCAGFHPLTMSVPDTIYWILRLFTVIFFALMLQRTIESGSKKWKNIVINTVIAISLIVAGLGFFIRITETADWLGSPIIISNFLISPPLINSNHASAFFGIAALLSLAFAMEKEMTRVKFLYGALFFVNLLAVISTLSRGGILAVFLAIAFLVIMRIFKGQDKNLSFMAIFLFLAIMTAFYTAYSLIIKEFDVTADNYFVKIEQMANAKTYFTDFWLTGSGPGSFMHVFPFYQTDPERLFLQFENEPIQLVLENGLFIGLAFMILIIYFAFKSNVWRSGRYAYLAILLFIVIHNTVDFNLHDLSIQFLAVLVLILLTDSRELKEKRRKVIFLFSTIAAAALTAGYVCFSERLDFNHNKTVMPYDKLVCDYPSNYSIPMAAAVDRLNSDKRSVFIKAGDYLSDTTAKAPGYYYAYYLTGYYLLRLNSIEPALNSYEKAIEKSDKKLSFVLYEIYKDLKKKRGLGKMRGMIPFDRKENYEQIEAFIARTADNPDFVKDVCAGHEKEFFIYIGAIYLNNNKFDDLKELVAQVEPVLESFDKAKQGKFYIFKGRLEQKNGDMREAKRLIEKGAMLTGDFWDWHALAYIYLSTNDSETERIDTTLNEKALRSKNELAYYYKWKSDFFWKTQNIKLAFSYLEKAADLIDSAGWAIELARRFAGSGMYEEAINQLQTIQMKYKNADPDNVAKLIEEYRGILKDKKENMMKELLLKQGRIKHSDE